MGASAELEEAACRPSGRSLHVALSAARGRQRHTAHPSTPFFMRGALCCLCRLMPLPDAVPCSPSPPLPWTCRYEVLYMTDPLDEYVMQASAAFRCCIGLLHCSCGVACSMVDDGSAGQRQRRQHLRQSAAAIQLLRAAVRAAAAPAAAQQRLCRPSCVLQNVQEFEDKEFANVSKEDLKLAGKDEDEKKREKKQKVGVGGWMWGVGARGWWGVSCSPALPPTPSGALFLRSCAPRQWAVVRSNTREYVSSGRRSTQWVGGLCFLLRLAHTHGSLPSTRRRSSSPWPSGGRRRWAAARWARSRCPSAWPAPPASWFPRRCAAQAVVCWAALWYAVMCCVRFAVMWHAVDT